MPVGVLEAPAGTKGDNGRLLGAAGDGGLFLGFGVLVRREETESWQHGTSHFIAVQGEGNKVPGALHKAHN